MYGVTYTLLVHLHGTLGANAAGVIPMLKKTGATLLEVAACSSNNSDATLKIGIAGDAADDDAFLVAKTIGDSSAPKYFTLADFDGALADPLKGTCPRFAPGEVVTWTLDYDGAGGTAAANVDIMFTFLEGGVVSAVTGFTP